METSWMLPLRPLADKRDPKDDLPIRIAQINTQRGSFRNVTEEGLQAEIDARREKSDLLDEQDADVKPPEIDTTERLDTLYQRRAEIIQYAL
jgi:mediator of RNA polymerase II transcription subunit 17, fungi type